MSRATSSPTLTGWSTEGHKSERDHGPRPVGKPEGQGGWPDLSSTPLLLSLHLQMERETEPVLSCPSPNCPRLWGLAATDSYADTDVCQQLGKSL